MQNTTSPAASIAYNVAQITSGNMMQKALIGSRLRRWSNTIYCFLAKKDEVEKLLPEERYFLHLLIDWMDKVNFGNVETVEVAVTENIKRAAFLFMLTARRTMESDKAFNMGGYVLFSCEEISEGDQRDAATISVGDSFFTMLDPIQTENFSPENA